MDDKKTSVLALLSILQEHSDENHILRQPELLSLLETIYGVKLDRRTLYKNIEMLENFGYDISTYSENGKGYYLRERLFESSEVNILCNAVHSTNFIPLKSSKDIIDKLLSTQSKYFKNDFKSTVFMDNKDKKENKQFFLNVEIISDAIKQRKVIEFNYTKYNLKKELINRREEKYIISPYYMIYKEDKTFLIGKSNHHDNLTHFRVDKMKNVKLINEKYTKLLKTEDPYEYAKNKLLMFNGDEYRISLKCDNSILDDIIDIFGKDITLINNDENSFIAHVKSTKQGMVYLALQYLNHLEVIEPIEIRNEIIQSINNGKKKYK